MADLSDLIDQPFTLSIYPIPPTHMLTCVLPSEPAPGFQIFRVCVSDSRYNFPALHPVDSGGPHGG